jgi:hypothetical protein
MLTCELDQPIHPGTRTYRPTLWLTGSFSRDERSQSHPTANLADGTLSEQIFLKPARVCLPGRRRASLSLCANLNSLFPFLLGAVLIHRHYASWLIASKGRQFGNVTGKVNSETLRTDAHNDASRFGISRNNSASLFVNRYNLRCFRHADSMANEGRRKQVDLNAAVTQQLLDRCACRMVDAALAVNRGSNSSWGASLPFQLLAQNLEPLRVPVLYESQIQVGLNYCRCLGLPSFSMDSRRESMAREQVGSIAFALAAAGTLGRLGNSTSQMRFFPTSVTAVGSVSSVRAGPGLAFA